MTHDFDVVVLGGGNAGVAAASAAKAAGRSVALVESREVGGTCPLRGCVPKKVLVATAEALQTIALAPEHHISVGPARLDWPKLIERKQTFVDGVPEMFEDMLKGRGIEVVHGGARFLDPHTVAIDGTPYRGGKIVIATGSAPRSLPIPGFAHVITSEDILDLDALPESLIFIGAGVIGLEFTHVFTRAGTKVTIIELAERPLPALDADVVARLADETRRLGVDLYTGARTTRIERGADGLVVHFEHEGKQKSVAAALVANGAGRVPDVAGLDLAAGNIDHDGLVIAVDDYLRSRSNADVFVAGDAGPGPQLSPVASYEGRIVGHNLVNGALVAPSYLDIPAAVFTVPTLASVGYGEEAAGAAGLDFEVKANDFTSWRSARTYAETAAFSKVLVEKGSGRILGAHLLSHGAGETVHLFAFAIRHGITAPMLTDTTYAYPTFASDIKNML